MDKQTWSSIQWTTTQQQRGAGYHYRQCTDEPQNHHAEGKNPDKDYILHGPTY